MTPRLFTLISRYQLLVLSALAFLCLWLWPQRAVGVLAGGVLMAANFGLGRFLTTRAFHAERPKAAYALGLALKFIFVVGLIAFLVLVLRLDALGFAMGMLTLFIGIGLGVAHAALAGASPTI